MKDDPLEAAAVIHDLRETLRLWDGELAETEAGFRLLSDLPTAEKNERFRRAVTRLLELMTAWERTAAKGRQGLQGLLKRLP